MSFKDKHSHSPNTSGLNFVSMRIMPEQHQITLNFSDAPNSNKVKSRNALMEVLKDLDGLGFVVDDTSIIRLPGATMNQNDKTSHGHIDVFEHKQHGRAHQLTVDTSAMTPNELSGAEKVLHKIASAFQSPIGAEARINTGSGARYR